MGQTIHPDICHTLMRRAVRTYVSRMVLLCRRRTVIIWCALLVALGRVSNLQSCELWAFVLALFVVRYSLHLPLPSRSIQSVLASRLCPDRIMQPQPLSDVNPF